MTANRYDVHDEVYITDLLTDDDIPSLIKYLNNPKIHANTLTIPSPYTEKDGEDFIKMSTNELIGACGLHRCPKNERRAGVGYWLAEPYWNRGIMPKVVTKAIEIGRSRWQNLVRIEAEIYSWNQGSMRVAEKCGFQFEGTLRKHTHKNGQDIDINSYALIFD